MVTAVQSVLRQACEGKRLGPGSSAAGGGFLSGLRFEPVEKEDRRPGNGSGGGG